MEISKNIKYDFDDILIKPSEHSLINSRSEINLFDEYGNLPIMTAPMDTVIDENNNNLFRSENIIAILPRRSDEHVNEHYWYGGDNSLWLSYSMTQFESLFLRNELFKNKILNLNYKVNVLIDIANGHMATLHDISLEAKNIYIKIN